MKRIFIYAAALFSVIMITSQGKCSLNPNNDNEEERSDTVRSQSSLHFVELKRIASSPVDIIQEKDFIDEAVNLLTQEFSDRVDILLPKVAKNRSLLINAERVLKEANDFGYRTPEIMSLRNRIFDVILCELRDFAKANEILKELEEDFKSGLRLSQKDYILHLISVSFFTAIYKLDYEKAIEPGLKALKLLTPPLSFSMNEEKVRLISNLLQYHSLLGHLSDCETLYQEGLKVLPLSTSIHFNSLFIYAASRYFLDSGKIDEAINTILAAEKVIMSPDNEASLRFFTLRELARAYIKKDELSKAQLILEKVEEEAKQFYADENDIFFAIHNILKATSNFANLTLEEAEDIFEKSLDLHKQRFKGDAKNRNQAEAHLSFGQLYDYHNKYNEAKAQYLKSEEIFNGLLKSKGIHQISSLYKHLALLGRKLKDETLIQHYLNKHIKQFGYENKGSQEIVSALKKEETPHRF